MLAVIIMRTTVQGKLRRAQQTHKVLYNPGWVSQRHTQTQAPCSRSTALIPMLCYTLKELPPSVIPSKAVILNFYTPNECSPPLVTGGLVSPYCIRAKVIPIPLFRCSSFATEAHSAGVHWALGEAWQNVALLVLWGWYTNCPCWRAPMQPPPPV